MSHEFILSGMGDMGGLIETLQDAKLDQSSMVQKLEKGEMFTLRDMYEQFQTIMSLGPLGKVMGMFPGMPPEFAQMSDAEGGNRLKRFMCIMDSMTEGELDSDGKPFNQQPSRIRRVAIGSGVGLDEVDFLLSNYKKMVSGWQGCVKLRMSHNLAPFPGRVDEGHGWCKGHAEGYEPSQQEPAC